MNARVSLLLSKPFSRMVPATTINPKIIGTKTCVICNGNVQACLDLVLASTRGYVFQPFIPHHAGPDFVSTWWNYKNLLLCWFWEEIMSRLFLVVFCCSIFLAACSVNTSSKRASQSQPATNGISLYEQYCASCHRSFAHTTNPQRSFSRLRSAIRFFPSMNDLYFLSDAQLEAISSALATDDFQQVSRIKSLK